MLGYKLCHIFEESLADVPNVKQGFLETLGTLGN